MSEIKPPNEITPHYIFRKIKAHQKHIKTSNQHYQYLQISSAPKNAINESSDNLCTCISCNSRHSKCSPFKNPHRKRSQHNTKHQRLHKKTASRQAAKEQLGRVKRRKRPPIETRVPRSQQCRRMPRLHAIVDTTHRSFEATCLPSPSGQTSGKYDAKHARTPPRFSQAASPDVATRSRLHRY